MKHVVILAAFLLSGCAGSSGVVPIGQNQYMIGGDGSFFAISGAGVVANLMREANTYCAQQGRTMVALGSESQNAAPYQFASAGIRFQCQ